jgi:hypothetical protein
MCGFGLYVQDCLPFGSFGLSVFLLILYDYVCAARRLGERSLKDGCGRSEPGGWKAVGMGPKIVEGCGKLSKAAERWGGEKEREVGRTKLKCCFNF